MDLPTNLPSTLGHSHPRHSRKGGNLPSTHVIPILSRHSREGGNLPSTSRPTHGNTHPTIHRRNRPLVLPQTARASTIEGTDPEPDAMGPGRWSKPKRTGEGRSSLRFATSDARGCSPRSPSHRSSWPQMTRSTQILRSARPSDTDIASPPGNSKTCQTSGSTSLRLCFPGIARRSHRNASTSCAISPWAENWRRRTTRSTARWPIRPRTEALASMPR